MILRVLGLAASTASLTLPLGCQTDSTGTVVNPIDILWAEQRNTVCDGIDAVVGYGVNRDTAIGLAVTVGLQDTAFTPEQRRQFGELVQKDCQ